MVRNPSVKPYARSAYPLFLTAHILYVPMYFKSFEGNFLNLHVENKFTFTMVMLFFIQIAIHNLSTPIRHLFLLIFRPGIINDNDNYNYVVNFKDQSAISTGTLFSLASMDAENENGASTSKKKRRRTSLRKQKLMTLECVICF